MKWLRNLIAEEVAKVEGKITNEREQIISFISIHTKTATNAVELEAKKLLGEFETKVREEVVELVADKNQLIAELEQKIKDLQDTAAKFSHWRAHPDTVQADQDLQKVK